MLDLSTVKQMIWLRKAPLVVTDKRSFIRFYKVVEAYFLKMLMNAKVENHD